MKKKTVACIFGTRPDTIKLAPVILALHREKKYFNVVNIATAQHRSMLDQVLTAFDLKPDHDLNVMQPNQTLAHVTSHAISAIDKVLAETKPDMVLVQGDTTTTFVGSLAAFYRQIPVGHVEAGLRTNNRAHPFPEEINRRLTGTLADLHFAPTRTSQRALLREHVPPSNVCITGNTVIDALHIALKKKPGRPDPTIAHLVSSGRRIILVTMHRRESWGEPMAQSCRALRTIADRYPDVSILFPVHLNPNVREVVKPILGDAANIHLIEPLNYLDFAHWMKRSNIIITDSGGIQEEAPALGKPVLVLREVTERPEAVKSGTVVLVGVNERTIVATTTRLLENVSAYRRMATAVNPYGDGRATERIVGTIKHYFGMARKRPEEFRAK